MPEIKCKKSSEEMSEFLDLCFRKSYFINPKKDAYEKIQRWASVTQIEPSSVIKKSLRDIELDKKIESLTKKVNEISIKLKNLPLVKNTTLRDLNSEKFLLKENIEIIVEEYPDEIIAQWPEVEVFGHGVTQPEAILDLKNEVIDLYEDISNTKKKELGKLPEMWLRILKKVIKKNE